MAREHLAGFEAGSMGIEGWAPDWGQVFNNAANAHRDIAGNGGSWYAFNWFGTSTLVANTHMRALVECHDRVIPYLQFASGWFDWKIVSGSTVLFTVRMTGNASVTLYRGDLATLVATSAAPAPSDRYVLVQIRFRLSDTVGLCEVTIDGTVYVTFSGDTNPGALTTFNTFATDVRGGPRLDEYGRNSITLQYDTEVAPFTAGQTVTGFTSGATAVISSVEDAGANGVLVLQQWNGTAYQNNEVITDGAGGSALVNAPSADYVNGFEPNSGPLPEGFVVALVPTGVGATTGLTSSTGGANWTNVDEVPPNTSDYNYSGVNNTFDTYAHAGSQLPASAVSVTALATLSLATRDGAVINNANHVLRTGGADYDGLIFALPISYAPAWDAWNVNPGTLNNFSVAEANGSEFGFKVLT